ncbi:MAG: nuclear transport factor 2 family protein [Pseudomonadota bacterium]
MSAVSLSNAAPDADIAGIETIVESVATLADRGNFEALEKLFADEVLVDYSSLSGAEPEVKSPQALMNEWGGVLPGFERTRHALSKVDVTISDGRAIATADVVADHFVAGLHWRVSGDYRYELVDTADSWMIAAVTFTLEDESGTRDVFGPAIENAAARPVAYLVRQQTIDAVKTMLRSLETKDMQAFAAVWADDAVQDMPYSPEGHPKRVVGKRQIVDMYSNWPENSGQADFTSSLVFYPMQDPQTVFVEFSGDVEIVPTGRRYQQTYGGLFHVVDGKIRLFREYYDPAPFAWAFGLDED